MRSALSGAVLMALCHPAFAVVIDSSKCVTIFDDAARLKCFDAAVKQTIEKGPPGAAPSAPDRPVASPAPVASPLSGEEFKVVDPNDVRNTPAKWQGRNLQFNNVKVYWVADNDVRILTRTNLTLFARNVIGPPEAIEHYRSNCETSRESDLPKCRANVRFSYIRHSTDSPGGLMTRTVLVSVDLQFVRPAARRR